MNRILLILMCAILFQSDSAYGNDIGTDLEEAYTKAVTGDIRPILTVFDSIENVDQSEFAELYEKYERRFITGDEQIEFDDPFITRLYDIYTTYWRSSLLDPNSEMKSRKILVSGLERLAKSEGRKASIFEFIKGPNIEDLETFFIRAVKEKGYNILMGMTIPLRELMIWKKEENETYHVKLPNESFPVNVIFARDFLSKGWLGYATFDKRCTGGWYKQDTIYCVDPKPDDNELFRVSILGHEGRHISDKRLYGELDSWLLEYRAKLTELLLAEKTFWSRLNMFRNEAKDNISIPHSYASHQLINDLIEELIQEQEIRSFRTFRFEDYSIERLKDAVNIILANNTRLLKAK